MEAKAKISHSYSPAASSLKFFSILGTTSSYSLKTIRPSGWGPIELSSFPVHHLAYAAPLHAGYSPRGLPYDKTDSFLPVILWTEESCVAIPS